MLTCLQYESQMSQWLPFLVAYPGSIPDRIVFSTRLRLERNLSAISGDKATKVASVEY